MAPYSDAAAFSSQWNSTENFWTEIIPNNVNTLIQSYHGQGCPCCTRPELGRPHSVNWAPSTEGTLRQLANYLTSGFLSDQGESYSTEFYNLSTSGTNPKSGTITYNYTGGSSDSNGVASADWKNLYDEAFKYLSATFGITFSADSSVNADIEFTDNESGAFNSNDGTIAGGNLIIDDSRLNISPSFADPSTFGGYAWSTVIHELGHSLGLGHQGNYNGSVNFNSDAVFKNDSWDISIMSYVDQTQNPYFSDRTYTDSSTFKPADLLALDDLYASQGYGTSNAFTGNTTYGFNTTINSSTSAIWNQMTTWIGTTGFTIADGAGTDTIDLSGFSTGETLDLRASEATSTSPYYSSINGRTNNLSIAVGTVIENAIGGSGADTITGNSAANIIEGNAGNDTIDGGSGNDTLIGGAGADQFRIASGNDAVTDFSSTEGDTIGITYGLTYTLADVGSDLKITTSDGATITLNGLQQATFNTSTDLKFIGTPPPSGGGGGGGATVPTPTPAPTPTPTPTPTPAPAPEPGSTIELPESQANSVILETSGQTTTMKVESPVTNATINIENNCVITGAQLNQPTFQLNSNNTELTLLNIESFGALIGSSNTGEAADTIINFSNTIAESSVIEANPGRAFINVDSDSKLTGKSIMNLGANKDSVVIDGIISKLIIDNGDDNSKDKITISDSNDVQKKLKINNFGEKDRLIIEGEAFKYQTFKDKEFRNELKELGIIVNLLDINANNK